MTYAQKGKLLAVIGDEDTVVGFMLGGIGQLNKARKPNFFVVEKNTSISEIEEAFNTFTTRDDIAIILINQHVAEMIRYIYFTQFKFIFSIKFFKGYCNAIMVVIVDCFSCFFPF